MTMVDGCPDEILAAPHERTWFAGHVYGSFVGIVRAVDLRGALPEIKLILAGGKQIDCVCTQDHIEQIRGALNRRVRIEGNAIYDGKSGLPRRVEVRDISSPIMPSDFAKWCGAFEPFEIDPWEDGET